MSFPEIDIFSFPRGSITAPAGCGKTQLIASALGKHNNLKPILVLTHTNAGVAALRTRLQRNQIPHSAYQVLTIDGFAMRLAAKFPLRSGLDRQILELKNPKTDYPAIRRAAQKLLSEGHIVDSLKASYSRLIVDEYQDCNVTQHAIVCHLAQTLPTCVLGDPLQAIFGFSDRLVNWETEVLVEFPPIGTLQTPWRWTLANMSDLGEWLFQIRTLLQEGKPIDLGKLPNGVEWVQLTPGSEKQQRLSAARSQAPNQNGSVLVIGDSINVASRQQLSMQTPGATCVEAVDLKDLVSFARKFDLANPQALQQISEFATSVMTGVGVSNLLSRVEIIRGGRARSPATAAESAALAFVENPSYAATLKLLEILAEKNGGRVYRPEVLYCCLNALRAAQDGGGLLAAALSVRERNRQLGRTLGRRAVGSTLLLKGLEADVVVILEPEQMNAQHLYVALTRGSRRIVICSTARFLKPAHFT